MKKRILIVDALHMMGIGRIREVEKADRLEEARDKLFISLRL